MSGTPTSSLAALVGFWWVRLPLRLRRVSPGLGITFVDGVYLAVLPIIGAWISPLVLMLGFLVGWLHPGFKVVFSESIVVLALATCIGVASAHLGALFLVGFVLGDFLFADTGFTIYGSVTPLLRLKLRVPMLIEYGLLAVILINVPQVTKGLLVQFTPPIRLSRSLRFAFPLGGHALITAALVYFWTQSVPILIRPVFTWPNALPSIAAMVPLQQTSSIFVVVGVVTSVARMLAQRASAPGGRYVRAMDAVIKELQQPPVRPLTQRFPAWMTIIVQSLWATLLLAGMMESWFDALLIGATILFIQGARKQLIRIPFGRWPAIAARIPLLIRLLGGFAIIFFISRAALQSQISQQSFRPIVFLTVLSMLLFYVLAPGNADQPNKTRGTTA